MKIYYDLHIHTALSPCADDDMTPNNIVNMAHIKGLNLIAITDHNSVKNCRACILAASELPLLVIPGMELQTKEDVHVLCYFRNIDDAEKFENQVDDYRIKLPNKPDRFGNQIIFNKLDEVVGEYPFALIASLDLSLNQVVDLVELLGGVTVPAHLDRPSNSLLSNLGFMPTDLKVRSIEISKRIEKNIFLNRNRRLEKYLLLQNSDAHNLVSISEQEEFWELKEMPDIDTVLNKLRGN